METFKKMETKVVKKGNMVVVVAEDGITIVSPDANRGYNNQGDLVFWIGWDFGICDF